MDVRVVVSAVGNLAQGLTNVVVGVERAHDKADLTRGVGGDGGVGVVGDGEELLGGSTQLANEVEVNPNTFALGRDVSAGLESLLEESKVRLLEESLCGPTGSDESVMMTSKLALFLGSWRNLNPSPMMTVDLG